MLAAFQSEILVYLALLKLQKSIMVDLLVLLAPLQSLKIANQAVYSHVAPEAVDL